MAKERPGHIVKGRQGTRCMRGRERRAIRFGNKLVREERAGWRDGRARKRQISRRFPAGARRDEGLQRNGKHTGGKGSKGQKEAGNPLDGQWQRWCWPETSIRAIDMHSSIRLMPLTGSLWYQAAKASSLRLQQIRQLSFSGEFNSFIVSISSKFCRAAFTQEGRGGRGKKTHLLPHPCLK